MKFSTQTDPLNYSTAKKRLLLNSEEQKLKCKQKPNEKRKKTKTFSLITIKTSMIICPFKYSVTFDPSFF